jgi:hypothetical protein
VGTLPQDLRIPIDSLVVLPATQGAPTVEQGKCAVTTALLLDCDSLERSGVTTAVPRDTRYGLKMLSISNQGDP